MIWMYQKYLSHVITEQRTVLIVLNNFTILFIRAFTLFNFSWMALEVYPAKELLEKSVSAGLLILKSGRI